MNGDGFDEAVVANPITGIDSILRGEVYILRGGRNGPISVDLTIEGNIRFGNSVDSAVAHAAVVLGRSAPDTRSPPVLTVDVLPVIVP